MSDEKILDLEEYRLKREEAEIALKMQEVRNLVAQQRQGKILVALHYLIIDEMGYGLLTEEEVIEVVNIFASQINDGIKIL